MNPITQKTYSIFLMTILSFLFIVQAASVSVPSKAPTIAAAMASVKKGDTVWVEEGVYREHIYVNPGVTLISRTIFKAVIDGSGRGTVVTMSNGSKLSGFEIRNGTVGIFSTSAGVSITQCRIIYNQQTGIMSVGNLPKIEDNIIVYNRGSGIQGWDVRSTSASINHNTIAFNSNHGVAIGGSSSVILENSIIAFNDQFGVKPSEEAVRITMINNSFFQNSKFTNVLPSDNFSLDPMFGDAKKLNFMLSQDSRCIGKGSDNQDIGARVIY